MLEKRSLGRSGIAVSLLGFGGIPIMRVGQKEATETIKEAVKLGIDFFDTARGYADSEKKIGSALRSLGAEVVLASKSPRRDRQGMHQDFERSLRELGVKMIDLYQVHGVNTQEDYHKVLAPQGAYGALEELRSQGRTRFIGLTSHNLTVAEKAVCSGRFDTIQVLYSVLEPEAADRVIPLARQRNIGVIAMKPLGGGCIKQYDLALRFVLSTPGVISIPGMATPDEIRKNVGVARDLRPLAEEDLRAAALMRAQLGERYCRRCDYCQPCPQDVPIAFLLQVPSVRQRIGDAMMQTDSYRKLLEKAEGCTECGQCEERCPFGLPIRDLLKASRELLTEVLG
jgi:predicted aldo/keto reductase-like oxidoreductase